MANSAPRHKEGTSLDFTADTDVMFSDHKKRYRKRIERRQRKLARHIPFLGRFLDKGEHVLLIATGCSPMSIFEQFVTGVAIVFIKRSLFVFTNKRIFHIPTTWKYSYRNSIAQILYADCKSIRQRRGTLRVEYKKGKTEKFYYVARQGRKKIKGLLETVSFEGAASKSQGRSHLCPRCTSMLEKDMLTCPSCRLEFKDKSEGRRVSWIFPGGGYFYTCHPILGIADAVVEVILALGVVLALVDIVQGVEGAGAKLVILGIALAIEKVITVYHSNHFLEEFIPKEKNIEPISPRV